MMPLVSVAAAPSSTVPTSFRRTSGALSSPPLR
jgi:hypothetical protein